MSLIGIFTNAGIWARLRGPERAALRLSCREAAEVSRDFITQLVIKLPPCSHKADAGRFAEPSGLAAAHKRFTKVRELCVVLSLEGIKPAMLGEDWDTLVACNAAELYLESYIHHMLKGDSSGSLSGGGCNGGTFFGKITSLTIHVDLLRSSDLHLTPAAFQALIGCLPNIERMVVVGGNSALMPASLGALGVACPRLTTLTLALLHSKSVPQPLLEGLARGMPGAGSGFESGISPLSGSSSSGRSLSTVSGVTPTTTAIASSTTSSRSGATCSLRSLRLPFNTLTRYQLSCMASMMPELTIRMLQEPQAPELGSC